MNLAFRCDWPEAASRGDLRRPPRDTQSDGSTQGSDAMNAFDWGWLKINLDEGFSPHNVALLLWAGLAVLTVSLTVLARTRWGQAQPLSKCVFLSLYAHFLLGGYAYTTQVILAPPLAPRDSVIRLTDISPVRDDQAGEHHEQWPTGEPDSNARSVAPWENSANSELLLPNALTPERQEAAPIIEPTRNVEMSEPDVLAMAPTDAPLTEEAPERPVPQAPLPLDPVAAADAAPATEIEQPAPPMPQPEMANNAQPDLPGMSELARVDVPSTESPPTRQPATADLPREFLENAGGLQRLTDAMPAELASALRGSQDELQAATGRDGDPARGTNQTGVATPTTSGQTGARFSSSGQALGAAVAALPIPRRLGDGAAMPDLYRLRMGEGRALAARELGATPDTEAAVELALQWLAANQEKDGRWSAARHGAGREDKVLGHDRSGAGGKADPAVTALALLAFLGAGQTHLEGPYRTNVQHGLEYLLRIQRNTGDLSSEAEFFARMYCHGMASLALSEALALTGDERLRPFVERAVAFSLACQHSTNGGWRYQKGDLGDMSQFGWQVMALKSAELAGVPVPQTTHDGMRRFLRGASSGAQGGLASYRAGERVSRTMTAEALACRYFLDGEPAPPLRREATHFILEELPQDGRANFYYWYYATLALFQTQDDTWSTWNAALQQQLLTRQRRDGDAAGSWDPVCIWGGYGGRVYTTATACLCLEVYYRYLPITAN